MLILEQIKMKLYYIKERHNPQLSKPYYSAQGKLTKKEAKEIEKSLYGFNTMKSYNTEIEYKEEINKLKSEGFTVYNSISELKKNRTNNLI